MTDTLFSPDMDALERAVAEDVTAALVAEENRRRDQGVAQLTPDGRRAFGRKLVADQCLDLARRQLTRGHAPMPADLEDDLVGRVFDRLFGLGGFQRLLDDDSIENVFANGADIVWVTRADGSRDQVAPVARSDADLIDLIRQVAVRSGRSERRFDIANPMVNVRLPDGSRLFAVMEVAGRPSVSIRRHRHRTARLTDLERLGTVDLTLRRFLAAAVRARCNIVVAGGTDTGKTTLLRALVNEIAPHERLVVIEDNLELDLTADRDLHPNVVELEVREPNIEGEGAITMRDLTRAALRMSPDRVIVGEVRGGEVIDMLLAMSQGNDGSLCTLHADSSASAFSKIAMYAVMAPERLAPDATALLVANSLHLVVHLTKTTDGRRAVTSVREVVGADAGRLQSNEVFAPSGDGIAAFRPVLSDRLRRRLDAAGFEASDAASWADSF